MPGQNENRMGLYLDSVWTCVPVPTIHGIFCTQLRENLMPKYCHLKFTSFKSCCSCISTNEFGKCQRQLSASLPDQYMPFSLSCSYLKARYPRLIWASFLGLLALCVINDGVFKWVTGFSSQGNLISKINKPCHLNLLLIYDHLLSNIESYSLRTLEWKFYVLKFYLNYSLNMHLLSQE